LDESIYFYTEWDLLLLLKIQQLIRYHFQY